MPNPNSTTTITELRWVFTIQQAKNNLFVTNTVNNSPLNVYGTWVRGQPGTLASELDVDVATLESFLTGSLPGDEITVQTSPDGATVEVLARRIS